MILQSLFTKLPSSLSLLRRTAIFVSLAAFAGIAFALTQTNPVTATDNTIATATTDLLIAADVNSLPGEYATSIPGYAASNLLPGKTQTFRFWLKNASSAAVELNLFLDLIDQAYRNADGQLIAADATDLAQTLKISFSCNVSNSTIRDGGTPAKSLADWEIAAPSSVNDGSHVSSGRLAADNGTSNGTGADEARCTMTIRLDETSTAQATAAAFDIEVTGTHVGS